MVPIASSINIDKIQLYFWKIFCYFFRGFFKEMLNFMFNFTGSCGTE